MVQSDFNGCQLIISARSPFARRVRLAFHEHQIQFEESVIDVFDPPPDFEKINPVQRVPVAVLKNGRRIIDSNVILWKFYAETPSSLLPSVGESRDAMFHWTGVAMGISEAVVGRVIEKMKGEKTSRAVLDDFESTARAGLKAFDSFIASKEYVAGPLTQGDLDMGTALDYFTLRISDAWKTEFKNAARYFEKLSERPSFRKTVPPPAQT